MKRRVLMVLMIVVGAVAIFFGGWSLAYPPPDPKSIQYVLWKADLYKLALPDATGAMVGDPHRDDLVLGKTRAQLEKRFGPLVPLADAPPYLRACYQDSDWKTRDVLFIANSEWMVVFDGGKAVDLVLMKGC
jgi:hypothetical protein